jgi:cobalt-zinc-cadmium efflux system outer membrane protein
MSLIRTAQLCAVLLISAAGCQLVPPKQSVSLLPAPVSESATTEVAAVSPVSYEEAGTTECVAARESDDPFTGQAELELSSLIDEVLARNPSLQVAIAAWREAAQRYPQVVSLDDPMFGTMLAPDAWGDEMLEGGYMLEASQKLPWPGKRRLRGQVALAEASAAQFDVRDTRLMLVEAVKLSFFDYYLARRQLDVNDKNVQIMQEFRNTASTKYRANLVTQQDVLQADVELAELKRRRYELERMEQVAVARINTLLHRNADHPLPNPPAQLTQITETPPAANLQELAIVRRPDLAAIEARIRAEQANVALAAKEFYPDIELAGRYDAFWQEEPLRPSVGVSLNVPIYRERRRAAVREAVFRVRRQRAEFEQQVDTIRNDVQAAFARLTEIRRVNELYQQALLPIAQQNVDAARSGYVAANVDFLRLIEAQRQHFTIQERGYEAEAEYRRRLAELERIVGGPLTDSSADEEMPTPVE